MNVRKIPVELLASMPDNSWVDHSRRTYAHNGTAMVPVREGFPYDMELPERTSYKGRGFFTLGDCIMVRGKKPTDDEIRNIIHHRNPRGIVWVRTINGVTRTPESEVLYGDITEVRHRENGYVFNLDPRTIMYSHGNQQEKARMADLVREHKNIERVADMFAGIGYFTIPMAGNGAFVHAMEINPTAFSYLKKNIALNSLSSRILPVHGDCRNLLSGVYDRIVMGHFDSLSFLPDALCHVQPGSTIHVHTIGVADTMIDEIVKGAGFFADINVQYVKKYRPHTWHVVQDVMLS